MGISNTEILERSQISLSITQISVIKQLWETILALPRRWRRPRRTERSRSKTIQQTCDDLSIHLPRRDDLMGQYVRQGASRINVQDARTNVPFLHSSEILCGG